MKANHTINRRRALSAVTAVALSAVMLVSVSCTRNDLKDDPKDTTAGTSAVTKPDSGSDNKPGMTTPESAKPLDPGAGTVNPDADPGTPPAGTESGKGMRSRFMH